jgi:hypothetical protein
MKSRKIFLRDLIFMACTLLFTSKLWAQPFVDPLQVRYTYAFRNNTSKTTPFTHLWAGSDVPIKLKENTYLLLSPYYEMWRIDSADKQEIYPTVHSFTFPVGLTLPLQKSKWFLTAIPIIRWNGEKLFEKNTFQFGGITFATWARKPQQKFRFGVYANDEFFGLFIIPLLGADWRIDEKNYLFGLLPGRLTYEHKWSKKLYGGATFRALTNSYRLSNGQYIRLDDNQLSLYLDYYPAKNICITMEPGYGVFRKIRTGIINNREYITNEKLGDGPFIKLSAAYRIRL